MKPGLLLLTWAYSVDLRIQMYMEPVLLNYGKLATKYWCIYEYFYSAVV